MNKDLKLGTILMFFCLFLWFYAIPFQTRGGNQALFPKFATIFLFVPAILLIIKGFRSRGKSGGAEAGAGQKFFSRHTLLILPMILAYIFLIDIIGYYVSSFLAIVSFMLYFGVRRPLPMIVTPSVLLLAVYIIIGKVLSFPMPEGFLF